MCTAANASNEIFSILVTVYWTFDVMDKHLQAMSNIPYQSQIRNLKKVNV